MVRQYYKKLLLLTLSIKSSYDARLLELIPSLVDERRYWIEKIKEIEESREGEPGEECIEEIRSLTGQSFTINEEIVVGMISEMGSIKSEIKSIEQQRAASNSYKKASLYNSY